MTREKFYRRGLKKSAGFTLVELIVTLALVALVIAAALPLYAMVTRFNTTADELAQAQNFAQTKLIIIENELRYASTVNIEETVPGSFDDTLKYMYAQGGVVKSKVPGFEPRPMTSDLGFEDYTYSLRFYAAGARVIRAELTVYRSDRQVHRIRSDIYASNLFSGSVTGAAQGTCVSYLPLGALVSGVTVTSLSDTIDVKGQTLRMTATVAPANAANRGVAWSVDNAAIASIDQTGVLTPLANGIVTVKATALDGSAVFGAKQIAISNQ